MHLNSIFTTLLLGASSFQLSSAASIHRRECKVPTPVDTATCSIKPKAWGNPTSIKIGVPHSDELCGKLDALQRKKLPAIERFRCQKDGCGLTKVSFSMAYTPENVDWANDNLAKVWPQVKFTCPRDLNYKEKIVKRECKVPMAAHTSSCKPDNQGFTPYWHIKIGEPHTNELCGKLDALQRTNSGIDNFRCRKDGCGLTKIGFSMKHNNKNAKWINDNLSSVWPDVKFECPTDWKRDVPALFKRECLKPTPKDTSVNKVEGAGNRDWWRIKIGVPHSNELCGKLDALQKEMPDFHHFSCKKDGCGLTKIHFVLDHYEKETKMITEALTKVWPQVKFDIPKNWVESEKINKRIKNIKRGCDAAQGKSPNTQSCEIIGTGADTKWNIRVGVKHKKDTCKALKGYKDEGFHDFHCDKGDCDVTKLTFNMDHNQTNAKFINTLLTFTYPEVKDGFSCPLHAKRDEQGSQQQRRRGDDEYN
ncbi:hypothetical protein CBER1_11310 [Cercospora berteroae]|uniref:Uncharacterized protein n=1 Tax=Cercospora berteroae TaxID=357750 RepID=A0A2S6BZG3_9PEZI|nr:hypothetical protein CBER1_11310 [Cercospora berteroae]